MTQIWRFTCNYAFKTELFRATLLVSNISHFGRSIPGVRGDGLGGGGLILNKMTLHGI